MLIKRFCKWQDHFITSNFNLNLYTNTFGLARTILASSLLLTLLFNRIDTLFPFINNSPSNSLLKIDSIFNTLNFFLIAGLDNIKIMYFVGICLLVLISSGLFPSIFCIIHWWIQFSFINSSSCVDGGDQIASNLCLLLIPIYLFDNRMWHWKNADFNSINSYKLILSNLFYRLVRLQMCIIYFHAATGKLSVKEWSNGTAVYYWVNSSFFKMSPNLAGFTMYLFSYPIILALITWGVMIFEILMAFGLISSMKYRKYLFKFAIVFHFLFLLYFGLVSFFLVMTSGLLFYLFNPRYQINFKGHANPDNIIHN